MTSAARIAAVCALVAFGGQAAQAQQSDSYPARVQASYDVAFNGIKVGAFDFTSTQQGGAYTLNGNSQLSLLFGAIKWRGDAQASGKVASGVPKPQAFSFTYQGGKKAGSTKVAYSGDTITQVLHDPPKEPKEGTVPVQPAHLKAVLDPMSAVMALTKGTDGNPCARRIPVYDGKVRFDLLLSPRGTVQLTEQKPSGQPGTGYVCRVKYVPISGHKADEETKYMSGSDGIEVILRPIPSANAFVPYKVTIPTMAGPATLTAKRVDITTAQQQQIALSH
jgi:hypothetical protein